MFHLIDPDQLQSDETSFIFNTLEQIVKGGIPKETKQIIAEIVLKTLPQAGIILRSHDDLVVNLISQDVMFTKALIDKTDHFYLEHALLS